MAILAQRAGDGLLDLDLHLAFEFLHDLIDDLSREDTRLGIEQFSVREQRLDQFQIRLDFLQQFGLFHQFRDPAAADQFALHDLFGLLRKKFVDRIDPSRNGELRSPCASGAR